MWLRGDAEQDRVFWSDTLARDGTCHFDAHLLKANCCQVAAKTVKGMWTARSENICCHGVADDFVSRLNVWCCVQYQYSLCAFLSNMRQNWHSGSAVLVVFLHCDGRQTSHPFAVCVPVNATYKYVSWCVQEYAPVTIK